MNTYYIIEYTDKVSRSSIRLAAVETLEDTELYIKEHHLMTKRIYKKWYPELKWTPKEDDPTFEMPVSKKYDTFTLKDKTEIIPIKHYMTRFWYSEPMLDNKYTLCGYESYEVFEMPVQSK